MTAPFILVGGVNTVADTPHDVSAQNIPENLALGHIRLHHLPEYQRDKGATPIALVGGGPSVADYADEISRFPVVVACGSAHDWLISRRIKPDYAVICDPDALMADYLRVPSRRTSYLVSSHCHPAVFKALRGYFIAIWHCHPVGEDYLKQVEGRDYRAIGGGCTVGLRALSIAITLGYKNIHFFGFDSCLGLEDAHHAYDFVTNSEELGQIYEIKIGRRDNKTFGERTYRCAGYHLAQADHFRQFLKLHGELFCPVFHGDGLLPDLWRLIEAEVENIINGKAA